MAMIRTAALRVRCREPRRTVRAGSRGPLPANERCVESPCGGVCTDMRQRAVGIPKSVSRGVRDDRPVRDALLFAALGPNPAALSEAIWALYASEGLRVVEAHLVVFERGRHYLEREFLAPGAALEQLRAALPRILGPRHVHVTVVTDAGGNSFEDDGTDASSVSFRRRMWEASRTCVGRARRRPAVFLLAGGRLRTATALSMTVFQLLARPGDRLLDVRVSDPRVEGGTGFFFPRQERRWVVGRGGARIDARAVEVKLVEVDVPHLRKFVPDESLGSLERALEAPRQTLNELDPPLIEIDLASGSLCIGGERVDLSSSTLLWYTALALRRLDPSGDGWLDVGDVDKVRECLRGHLGLTSDEEDWGRPDWLERVRGDMRSVLYPELDRSVMEKGERLKKVRADTRVKLEEWCSHPRRARWAPWVVPQIRKSGAISQSRLLLPAHSIKCPVLSADR